MDYVPDSHPAGDMDHSNHEGHDHNEGDHSMMMQMTFYASSVVTILFDGWKTQNAAQMFGSCLAVFALAVLFEGLRAYREHLYVKTRSESSTSLVDSQNQWLMAMLATRHLAQTALYGLQITLGYMLMLIFMTYNVYVCIAVVLGATFGFLLFGCRKWTILEMTSDHCG